ncbi:MAG: MFS transporter [Undibacterium sp.]|nr:MFS transporter [Undibacterium sp.]
MTIKKNSSRSPITWVSTLYIAEGLPLFAITLLAGLMYKSLGVNNDDIAYWTGLIGFAWVFKPLWSPFLEVIQNKKMLVILFQLIGGLSLGLVALSMQLPNYFAISIGLLAMVAIASATHDIVADGLYIASLNHQQQAQYAGWQGAFYNVARFLSLGVLIAYAGELQKTMPPAQAWAIIFALLGLGLVALALYHTWSLPKEKPQETRPSMRDVYDTSVLVIIDFFKKPGIWMMILFIILFRTGEGQVQTIGPLFLKEIKANGGLGLTDAQFSLVYGLSGTIAFIAGSIFGGYFAAWLGLRRALLWLILMMNVPNLVFFFLSTTMPDNLGIISVALSFEMFGYGFGFVGLILFMMQVVAPGKYQTAHYALSTGVMYLGFNIAKMMSGKIQMALGYKNFFIWVLISAIPALILSRFLNIKDKEKTNEAAIEGATVDL